MKRYLYILMIFIISCTSEVQEWGNAGKVNNDVIIRMQRKTYGQFHSMNIYCLRDFLIGADAGGTWEVITQPAGEDISGQLVGDNPCIAWDTLACGQYELNYIVGDSCCRDTALVRPLKCCLDGSSSCN